MYIRCGRSPCGSLFLLGMYGLLSSGQAEQGSDNIRIGDEGIALEITYRRGYICM
jgi:hypothetical protein